MSKHTPGVPPTHARGDTQHVREPVAYLRAKPPQCWSGAISRRVMNLETNGSPLDRALVAFVG